MSGEAAEATFKEANEEAKEAPRPRGKPVDGPKQKQELQGEGRAGAREFPTPTGLASLSWRAPLAYTPRSEVWALRWPAPLSLSLEEEPTSMPFSARVRSEWAWKFRPPSRIEISSR